MWKEFFWMIIQILKKEFVNLWAQPYPCSSPEGGSSDACSGVSVQHSSRKKTNLSLIVGSVVIILSRDVGFSRRTQLSLSFFTAQPDGGGSGERLTPSSHDVTVAEAWWGMKSVPELSRCFLSYDPLLPLQTAANSPHTFPKKLLFSVCPLKTLQLSFRVVSFHVWTLQTCSGCWSTVTWFISHPSFRLHSLCRFSFCFHTAETRLQL